MCLGHNWEQERVQQPFCHVPPYAGHRPSQLWLPNSTNPAGPMVGKVARQQPASQIPCLHSQAKVGGWSDHSLSYLYQQRFCLIDSMFYNHLCCFCWPVTSCAVLDGHCSQITRLWFHIPHLHICASWRFILQIPWPQEVAIMFLHPGRSPVFLSPLNRAFVACHMGVSSGIWQHLFPADLLPASSDPAPRPSSPDLPAHRALGNRKNKMWGITKGHQSKALTPFFTCGVFSLLSCTLPGGNWSSRTIQLVPPGQSGQSRIPVLHFNPRPSDHLC